MRLTEAGEWAKLAGTIGDIEAILWGVGNAVWGWFFNDRPFAAGRVANR